MRMTVDAFGKIEIARDYNIDNINLEKDYSTVVYDNYSDRKIFGEYNDIYYNRNDGYRHNREKRSEIPFSSNDTHSVSTFFSAI